MEKSIWVGYCMDEYGANPTTMGHGRKRILEQREKDLRDLEIVSYLATGRRENKLVVQRSCRLLQMDEVPIRQAVG